MKYLQIIVILFGIIMNAHGESLKVETDSFLIELPSDWSIRDISEHVELVGPNNEHLIISSYRIDGEGEEIELQKIRNEFGKGITNTMTHASGGFNLKIITPLSKTLTPAGFPVWEIETETSDKLKFYNLYGSVGLKVALLITLEGEIKYKNYSTEVLSAIKNIKWH